MNKKFLNLESHEVMNTVTNDIYTIIDKVDLTNIESLEVCHDELVLYKQVELSPLINNINENKYAFYLTNRKTFNVWNELVTSINFMVNNHINNTINHYQKLEKTINEGF